jgi:hypothetical protein
MTIDVKGWDFGAYGGSGFGPLDVQAATQLGASQYQLGQLGQEASIRGLNVAKPLRGQWQSWLRDSGAPWDYGGTGNYGYGILDAKSQGDDLAKITEHANWAQANNLRIGPGVREYAAELQMKANEKRQNEMMSAMRSAYTPPPRPNLREGTPSAVGKPGTFTPKQRESGGKRRDLKSLRRKPSSGNVNQIGGVASGGGGLGINTAGLG